MIKDKIILILFRYRCQNFQLSIQFFIFCFHSASLQIFIAFYIIALRQTLFRLIDIRLISQSMGAKQHKSKKRSNHDYNRNYRSFRKWRCIVYFLRFLFFLRLWRFLLLWFLLLRFFFLLLFFLFFFLGCLFLICLFQFVENHLIFFCQFRHNICTGSVRNFRNVFFFRFCEKEFCKTGKNASFFFLLRYFFFLFFLFQPGHRLYIRFLWCCLRICGLLLFIHLCLCKCADRIFLIKIFSLFVTI